MISTDITAFNPERGEVPTLTPASADSDIEFSFWDFLDVVNPLQHIPIVSTIYREITGDEIGGFARLAGGLLFGGPVGLGVSAANLGLEMATGDDFGAHVTAALKTELPNAPERALALRSYDDAANGSKALGGEIDIPL